MSLAKFSPYFASFLIRKSKTSDLSPPCSFPRRPSIASPKQAFLSSASLCDVFHPDNMHGLVQLSRACVSHCNQIRTERGRVFGMGAANGAFTTSLSAGQVLGPLAFGVIADMSNIPTAFLIGGLFGLVGTVASFMFFRSETSYYRCGRKVHAKRLNRERRKEHTKTAKKRTVFFNHISFADSAFPPCPLSAGRCAWLCFSARFLTNPITGQ